MFKALLRTRMAELFSYFTKSRKKGGSGKAGKILLVILYLYLFVIFSFLISSIFGTFADALFHTEAEWLYYAFMVIFELMIGVFASFSLTENQLYEAKDNELLLTMPIPAWMILSTRIIMLLLWNLLTELMVVIPVAFVAISRGGMSTQGIIGFVLISLILPVIIMIPSCLIAWVMTGIKRKVGKSTIVSTILYLVFMGAYLYFYYNMNAYIQKLVENSEAVAKTVKKFFYPVWMMGFGVSEGKLLYCIFSCLIFVIIFALICLVLSANFNKIATMKQKQIRKQYVEKNQKMKSPSAALVKKELTHLLGNAGYLINATLGLLIMPIASAYITIRFRGGRELFQNVSPSVQSILNDNELLIIGIMLAGCAMMVFISAPSVSLEGKNLWIMKTIPVAPDKILMSKVWTHIVASAPFIILGSSLAVVFGRTRWINIPLIYLMPLGVTVFTALLGVMAGMLLPKFDYVNEVAVVKQSGATLITMMAGFAVIGIFGVTVLVLTMVTKNLTLACYIGCMFYWVLSLLIYIWLKTAGTKRFRNL